MTRSICTLLLLGIAASAAAGGAGIAPNRLDMFVGTWHGSGSMNAARGETPQHHQGSNACRWSSAAHLFLVCDGVFRVDGSPGEQHQISVYAYDPATGLYSFANLGGGHVGTPGLSLDGNTWTYSGKFTDESGKIHWFRTLNIFDSPARYRYEIQNSDDGVHWTTTGSGESRRQ
jgi:hypothetical protein